MQKNSPSFYSKNTQKTRKIIKKTHVQDEKERENPPVTHRKTQTENKSDPPPQKNTKEKSTPHKKENTQKEKSIYQSEKSPFEIYNTTRKRSE